MPFLDVSEVLYDPDFCQTLSIQRRSTVADTNGILQTVVTNISATGVIIAGTPPVFQQDADAVHTKGSITVHSTVPLYDVTTTTLPDYVLFNGDTYIVTKALPFSNYGAGFFCAYCEIVNLQGVPQ